MTVPVLLAVLLGQSPETIGTSYLRKLHIDTCAELAAIMGGETGSCGSLVLSASPTLTGLVGFGTAGVTFADDGDGALRLCGIGDGSDECVTFNLDDTSNTMVWSTDTGVSAWTLPFSLGGLTGLTLASGVASLPAVTSEGSPPYTFTGDTNTGVSSSGADILDFETAGSHRWRVSATGHLIASDDNTYTIGAAGARPASVNTNDLVTVDDVDVGDDLRVVSNLSFFNRPTVTVDGATTFAASASYVVLACTGPETISTITGGNPGMYLIIENTDTECTIADDNDPTASDAIDLTGSANDTGAVAKVIALIYNGTSWLELYESDN